MAFDADPLFAARNGPLLWRNAALDWAFYDMAGLSPAEIGALGSEAGLSGAILLVHPNPWRTGVAVEKFEGLAGFRAATGSRVAHLAVAGVGGTDLGAAALGRALANHAGAPVAAIAAGCSTRDLLAEAAGGWLLAGAARPGGPGPDPAASGAEAGFGWAGAVLAALLAEPRREARTLLAHSRGALAAAGALDTLAAGDPAAFARLGALDVVTAGMARAMPEGLGRVTQALGALDVYGELNSDAAARRRLIPRAMHHVNPDAPAHLDLGSLLDAALG